MSNEPLCEGCITPEVEASLNGLRDPSRVDDVELLFRDCLDNGNDKTLLTRLAMRMEGCEGSCVCSEAFERLWPLFPDEITASGESILEKASQTRHISVVRFVVEKMEMRLTARTAVEHSGGSLELVRLLFEHGAGDIGPSYLCALDNRYDEIARYLETLEGFQQVDEHVKIVAELMISIRNGEPVSDRVRNFPEYDTILIQALSDAILHNDLPLFRGALALFRESGSDRLEEVLDLTLEQITFYQPEDAESFIEEMIAAGVTEFRLPFVNAVMAEKEGQVRRFYELGMRDHNIVKYAAYSLTVDTPEDEEPDLELLHELFPDLDLEGEFDAEAIPQSSFSD